MNEPFMSDTVTLALLVMLGTGFAALAEVVRRMWFEQKALSLQHIECEKNLIRANGDIALLRQQVDGLTGVVTDKAAETLAIKLLEAAKSEAKNLLATAREAAEELKDGA